LERKSRYLQSRIHRTVYLSKPERISNFC
jgi:hypothetical protein